jgi:hypothetical protein
MRLKARFHPAFIYLNSLLTFYYPPHFYSRPSFLQQPGGGRKPELYC